MPRYYITDLSITYKDGLPEDGWVIDGEGNIVHECETVYEFSNSLIFNINVSVNEGDYIDHEDAYNNILPKLLKDGYVEVNGFGFSIEN